MKLNGITNCGKAKKATTKSAPTTFASEITGYTARESRIQSYPNHEMAFLSD
jgi:hypothetical protein